MSGRINVLKSPLHRPGWGFLLLLIARPAGVATQEPRVIDLPPADWTLRERQFSQIVSVRELAGRLLVSDATEDFIYVIDYESGSVRSLGTHGDGPGEYRDAGYLYALGGDSTLFTDPTTRRWLLVVGDRIVATIGATQPLPKRLGPSLWGADRSGRVLAVEGFGSGLRDTYPGTLRYPDADSVRILLTQRGVVGTGASRLDTIAELGGQGRLGAKRTTIRAGGGAYSLIVTSPLASGGQGWLFRDGWIAVAHPDPYKVDWRTPDGQWIRGAPLPVAPVPVNRREMCFALARHDYPEPCDPEISPGWPEYIPSFVMEVPWVTPGGTALHAAPNGMLLVKRTPTVDSLGKRYDLVDRRGTLRGVIVLRDDQAIVGHGRSSLYVVTKDDMDLLTLSRHPWPTQLAGQGTGDP